MKCPACNYEKGHPKYEHTASPTSFKSGILCLDIDKKVNLAIEFTVFICPKCGNIFTEIE